MTRRRPLEQIDLLLAAWDERLRRMDENLVALESEAIYQILAGKAGKRPALEGATKERVGPALDAVSELFENRERLAAVVAKAKEVRATISALTFWEKDEKIAEIHRLLRGTSIELGQKVVALSERNLLDQGYHDVLIDPEQLLAPMATRFQEARTMLLAVSRAWEALDPAMARIEGEMTRPARPRRRSPARAQHRAPKDLAELTEAEAELALLRARVAKDPLGAQGGVERIGPAPRRAARPRSTGRAEVRGRVESRAWWRPAICAAASPKAHARALRLSDEARREIGGRRPALPPVIDEALFSGLDEWLHKIEGTVEGRRWSPAEVGLDALARHCRGVLCNRRRRGDGGRGAPRDGAASSPGVCPRGARRPRRWGLGGSCSIPRSTRTRAKRRRCCAAGRCLSRRRRARSTPTRPRWWRSTRVEAEATASSGGLGGLPPS